MKAEEVAQFLNQHPEFFEDYAEMLAEVVIPHPHGGRAIPISERQILSLREKARRLESKLGELIRFGEQNDAITDKLHRMTLALIAARDAEAVLHVLAFNLREDFAVPHVAVRLWERSTVVAATKRRRAKRRARLRRAQCDPTAARTRWRIPRPGSAKRRRTCVRSPMFRLRERRRLSACWRWRARTRSASTRKWARSTCADWERSPRWHCSAVARRCRRDAEPR